MSKKKIIKLDVSGCKYLGELHERIRIAFNFPEWYGKNWNAFWDLLRSECDAAKVEITGEHTLDKEFNWNIETMHKVLHDFQKNCEKYGDHFEFEIID